MNEKEKPEKSTKKKETIESTKWFTTLTYIGIPIIGFIYLIILSKSKKDPIKRDFAKAYIKFKLLHFTTMLIILIIAIYIAIPYIDKLLAYMDLL